MAENEHHEKIHASV